jgi:AhpD family alkylhydroperoxidase
MSRLPSHYQWFQKRFPAVAEAYEGLGDAVHAAGPLDEKTRALIKVAISGAARLEGGLHAHVRKALTAGATPDEIYNVLLLLVPTVGFPGAMAALAWARDVIEEKKRK